MACTGCKKKKIVEPTIAQEITDQFSQFKMRANTGVHQIEFGSGSFISNANMTDELAIDFLKENPNRISLFEVYPDNWKSLLVEPVKEDKASTDGQIVSKSK